jgi:hypothetical protein
MDCFTVILCQVNNCDIYIPQFCVLDIEDLYRLVLHCVTAVAVSSQQHRDGINEKSIKWVKVLSKLSLGNIQNVNYNNRFSFSRLCFQSFEIPILYGCRSQKVKIIWDH